MVYFNISVRDSSVVTFIIKDGNYIGKVNRKTKSTFVDPLESYKETSNSILEALTEIEDGDDYSIYITLPSWFSLTEDEKVKWRKGLFGSFPETNNITIDTVSKASLYYTDESFENRISIVFNDITTGWIQTKKESRPILGYGYLINSDPLSLFDIGGAVISFIFSYKSDKLVKLLYKELSMNNKVEILNKIYSNTFEGWEMIVKIGSRKFLNKLKKEMTVEQIQVFSKILRQKIDYFVFWLYQDVKNILSEGRVSFALIGEVFYDSKPLCEYLIKSIKETFKEDNFEVKFEEPERDLEKSINLMINELKWEV